MKILAVIIALCAVAHALPSSAPIARESCQLQSDLRELIALIDRDAIAVVLWRYYDDPEVNLIFAFVFSQEFRDLYLTAAAVPEIEQDAEKSVPGDVDALVTTVASSPRTVPGWRGRFKFGLWMEAQCVDVRPFLNRIREYFALPPVHWNYARAQRGGIAAFWDDLRAAFPFTEIYERSQELYVESPDFAAFIDNLRGPEAQALYQQLAANEVFQDAVQRLRDHGIDIDFIRDIAQAILGW
ncbi:hypothetical protein EVAR_76070_1 [Eumeta japonica]|uniref:Protein G12 n=1 Tax=Eumeta variegata TaxID=151549 RepID=A0A4C1W6L0_EUMVA|nr:hypothetical protein EVAR_76070_1 [Eumeta japonica]